jgi:murein DD-endopeptidase MepM/ murein hydrolase activator NlpD
MVNPVPGKSITTAYWKAGSAWSCGYHDGVDFAAPAGTDVVAAWGGTVVEVGYPTSFGSAFGRSIVIDHDKLPDGSPGLWGLYAHLSAENVSEGQRVEAGQKIGDVGTTGNSSGNHLHFGIYAQPHWVSCGGKNPQAWIDAHETLPPGPVYRSKLVAGQKDSDSVRRWQDSLNKHPLEGGENLPITGNFLDQTEEETYLCADQHGFAKELPPTTAHMDHLLAGTGHEIINDVTDTEEPEVPTDGGNVETDVGIWDWYSEKFDSKKLVYPDGKWHNIDLPAQPASGITGKNKEEHFLYLRIHLPSGRSATRTIHTRFVRSDGDETAYKSPAWDAGASNSIAYENYHPEKGSGLGGHWEIMVDGGTDPIDYTTRYAKTYVTYRE